MSYHSVPWALLPDSPLSNPCLNSANHKPSPFPHASPFLIFLPTHHFALCSPRSLSRQRLRGFTIYDCRSSRSRSRQRLDGFKINHQSSIINHQSPIFNVTRRSRQEIGSLESHRRFDFKSTPQLNPISATKVTGAHKRIPKQPYTMP